jgi:hypothetical protein
VSGLLDAKETDRAENHKLFMVALVSATIAIVIIPKMRVQGGVNSATCSMTEQWLAEDRASHSL